MFLYKRDIRYRLLIEAPPPLSLSQLLKSTSEISLFLYVTV